MPGEFGRVLRTLRRRDEGDSSKDRRDMGGVSEERRWNELRRACFCREWTF